MTDDPFSSYPDSVRDSVRDSYQRATQDNDPAAMFAMGEVNEQHAKSVAAARAWYRWAAEKRYVPAVHALARLAAAEGDVEQARSWLRSLDESTDAHDLVSVAPDVFRRPWGPGEGWESSPVFLVISPDNEAASAVLYRARLRLSQVDIEGREVDDWEVDAWTANYTSDVFITDTGPVMYLDTKGELSAAMGESMLRILTEELADAGIAAHVAGKPDDLEFGTNYWTPADEEMSHEADTPEEPTAWFVARPLSLRTLDGRRYNDIEYRRADGSWVKDRAIAEQFTDPPLDLIDRLRAQDGERDEHRGEVNGWSLPVTPGDLWPMPPPHLRADD